MVAFSVRLERFYLAWNTKLQELVFVATPMTFQQFQHSPNLFGDCKAYGVWPTESFHPVLLRHLCVLSRVFLVRAMFIRLAAIVNEISTVVISGEGFRYSLSFPRHFVLSGRMFFARSMRVRTTEFLYWGWWCDLKTRSVLVAFL